MMMMMMMMMILHFGGLTYTFTFGRFHSFRPASNSDVVERFSAVMFRYFSITFVVALVVGSAGVTIGKLLFA